MLACCRKNNHWHALTNNVGRETNAFSTAIVIELSQRLYVGIIQKSGREMALHDLKCCKAGVSTQPH
jgi:hypothetical protein